MANTIKLKRGTSTPSTSDIASGEVAIDTSAQKLYINDSGTVKEIGGGSSIGGNTGVDFNDSVKVRFGTGNDLELYHDGSHSFIKNSTGNLQLMSDEFRVKSNTGNEAIIQASLNGAVDLYYDNVVKLQTQSWGVLINDQLKLTDSKSLFIGDGNDFQIYHDGSNTHLENVTGVLNLRNSSNIVLAKAHAETLAVFTPDGANELYYDNSKKLETTSTGTTITGQSLVDIGTSLNSATNYSGENFGLLVNSNQGNNNGNEGNGICFAQRWDASDGTKIRTGAVIGYKDAGTGTFGGGLKLKVQQAGATPLLTALTLKANGDVRLPADSQKLQLGGSQDLAIFHDGSHSYIQDSGTGNLNIDSSSVLIRNPTGTEDIAKFIQDGAVELYYDNVVKLQTQSWGVLINDQLKLTDSKSLFIGDGNDFQIYHDGSNTHLENVTGVLNLRNSANIVLAKAHAETLAVFTPDGANELYYDNSKKLETSSTGVAVTGVLDLSGNLDMPDSSSIRLGTDDDLRISFDGSASVIAWDGTLFASGSVFRVVKDGVSENIIWAKADGSVDLYYDNSKKFETTSDGATFSGSALFPDNQRIKVGGDASNPDLQIWHDGTSSYIWNETDNLTIKVNEAGKYLYLHGDKVHLRSKTSNEAFLTTNLNGAVELYYDNSKKFETTNGGVEVASGNSLIIAGTDSSSYIQLKDDAKLYVGTGNDLQISHTGSYSLIFDSNNQSDLYIQTNERDITLKVSTTETAIVCNPNSAVELYYDNSKKIDTNSGGVKVYGNIDIDDNNKLRVGTSSDLQIYHDGTSNIILANSGDLNIRTNNEENSIVARQNGSAELYYDNGKRFETISNGVRILGAEGGNANLQFYADEGDDNGDKWQMYASDAGGFIAIKNYASGSWETSIECNNNGNVEIYYDNAKRLETTSSGITIPNTLTVSDGANIDGDIKFKGSGDGDDFFWDKSADQLTLTDSRKIRFGDSGDLEIYHDGSDSYIKDAGTGILVLQTNYLRVNNAAGNETIINAAENGSVDLYYDNSKKLETAANGVLVSGYIDIENGHLYLRDSYKAQFGASQDLQIFHDGTNSNINNSTGTLKIGCSNNIEINTFDGHAAAKFINDGAVELYHNNALKFATTSNGVNVSDESGAVHLRLYTGTSTIRGYLYADDSNRIYLLDAQGHATFKGVKDGAAELYYDNSKKLNTHTDGVEVLGKLYMADNKNIELGNSQDLKILHDSSGDSYIQDKGSGNLYITGDDIIIQNNDTSENIAKFIENSYVSFYFDNSQKFYTQSYGCVCAGDFKPESNNTYNLGDSSYRWANLYVNDMHFSNEGKSNSVDGTWGDWTLQEGDENIFMINNRTGKKYKMGLQEVN